MTNRRTAKLYFVFLAVLSTLTANRVIAADASFFGCNGNVYDQTNDRIRTFAVGFILGRTVGTERAYLFFDDLKESSRSASRPYGMAECRREANTSTTCDISTNDSQSGLPQKLSFVRDEKGMLKFSSGSGLVGVTLSGKRCEPAVAPRWFDILDVSFVGIKSDPALYGTKVTIRPKTKNEIVECGGEIRGFERGERLYYRGWFSEKDGGSCTISEGRVAGTKVLWMTKKVDSKKIEPGFYFLDRVWIYTKGDTWPSNEEGWAFDGFVVTKK